MSLSSAAEFKSNGINKITLSDYSVKMGRYVNESKLRKEIKAEFGFTKSAIDLILSIH